jgi:hypothetical protein
LAGNLLCGGVAAGHRRHGRARLERLGEIERDDLLGVGHAEVLGERERFSGGGAAGGGQDAAPEGGDGERGDQTGRTGRQVGVHDGEVP